MSTVSNENTVSKHLKLSDAIDEVLIIRTHLINEFLTKKATPIIKLVYINKFAQKEVPDVKITDEHTEQYYLNYLLTGKKRNSDRDTFPSHFRTSLKDLFISQLTNKKFSHITIYEEMPYLITSKKYLKFDKSEWLLDESINMTDNDKQILDKYKVRLVALFENVLQLIPSKRSIRNELKRIQEVTNIKN